MSASLSGAVAAQEVDSADRTIMSDEVEPGGTVTVEVTASVTDVDSQWGFDEGGPSELDYTNEDPDPDTNTVVPGDDGIIVGWGDSPDSATLTYDVDVPETAADGQTYTLSGVVQSPDFGDFEIQGDDTITVNETDDDDGDEEDPDTRVTIPHDGDRTDASNAAQVYQGETITIETMGNGDDVELRNTDTGVQRNFAAPSGESMFDFDTEDLDTGSTYSVNFPDGGDRQFFNVSDLGLEVSIDENNVTTDDTIEANIEAVEHSRDVNVELQDADGNNEAWNNQTLNYLGEETANFSDVDEGTYTVEVTDERTEISTESDEINVEEAADEDAVFSPNIVTEQRGDVAEIELDLTGTDEATLSLGNNDTVHYTVIADVTAPDEGDSVTVKFNSYTAGTVDSDGDLIGGSDVMWTDDDDASVDVQTQTGAFVENNIEDGDGPSDATLDASTEYTMNVSTGHNHWQDDREAFQDPASVGTLNLVESETVGMTSHVAPEGTSYDDAADVWSAIASDELTESDEVAIEDTAVLHLESSGIGGAIEYEYDGDATDAFLGENDTLAHDNPGINEPERPMEIDDSSAAVTADPANDSYFVAIDTDMVGAADREYTAHYGAFGVSDETNESFTLVDRDASLDTTEVDGEDWVAVQPSAGQNMSGETNIAPGSDVTVYAKSRDSTVPFLITPTTTVQADGTFSAGTDEFADRALGTEFDTTVRQNNDIIGDEYDGVINEAPDTPTPTPTATPEPTPTDTPMPTDTAEPTATDTPDGPDSPTPTDGTGPGFGIAVSLIALIGAALLAARRYD